MEFVFHPIFLLPFMVAFVGVRYWRRAATWLAIVVSMLVAVGYLYVNEMWPMERASVDVVVFTVWGLATPTVIRFLWRAFKRRMKKPKFFLGFVMVSMVIIYVTVPQSKSHLEPIIGSLILVGVLLLAHKWLFSGLLRRR